MRYKLSLILFLAFSSSFAQERGKVLRSVKDEYGTYKQIKFDVTQKVIPTSESKQVLKSYLELKSDDELKLRTSQTDQIGDKHDRYDQYYKNVKVEFGSYIVHSKGGVVSSVNGEFKLIKDVNTQPSISVQNALDIAVKENGGTKYMWERPQDAKLFNYEKPKGELVIMDNKLAYKFDIYSTEPTVKREYVYVDAHSGKVLFKNPIIKHAVAISTADTRYSGTKSIKTDSNAGSYRLRDYSRGNGIETYDMNTGTNYTSAVDFTDADNNWTSAEYHNATKDDAALDAHWGAQMTYDYFSTTHGRNSYDGAGAVIKSYVHYDVNYENAYWNGSVMTYGDGATRFDALTSLDVAAHEIGHAVCETTANLVYSNESGAMNEGLSDIWGASVEYFAAPTKSTWLIGEDIDKQQPSLRSMSDPKAEGQPDTYKGTNWYTGTADNGGVHTNSGVLNHWYYILSVGKTGTNDIGTSYSVTGIGITKAAKIVYRMESVYLTSTSVYADARTYSVQAAVDLYGAGSNEVIQTTNAWNAVGIGGKFGEVSYCASKGNNATYEWVSGVTIGSYTHTSTGAGYSDFTNQTVNLTAGSNYSISLTPGFSGTSYNEYWKIWIDYNNNGSFTDAGELVFDAGALSKTTVSGTISVPSTATGTVRMRVSMKYNASQTACETFSYGEVEDYTVSFSGAVADTQAPSTPTGLVTSNISATSATLSWTASTDNVGVTGYDVYKGGILAGSTTSTSYVFSGLTPATTYSVSVKAKDAAGNVSAAGSASFTTSSAVVSYCASRGNNASYEWIDLVELGTMSNVTSANGGYGDFTNLTASVTAGSSTTIYISAGFSGSSYTEYWKVWIDLNHDGDFADAGEELVSGSSSSSAKLSATFTVPTTATLGATRMRVTMKYNSAPTSCETFSYGEVEDYTVNITNAFTGFNALSSASDANLLGNELPIEYFTPYPNPVKNSLSIAFNDEAFGHTIRLISPNGTIVRTIEVNSKKVQIDMSGLPHGIYIVSLQTEREAINKKIIKE